ncbi:MAG TPA: hypothetical protein VE090_06075 [Methylomirabilota bacterium]|nr:hypothetical protein [Methylomirabilota bacterium]
MAQKYWFKAHQYGYGWSPSSWQGWLVFFLYIAAIVYSFIQIDMTSHSVSDTLLNFLPRIFIFSALLIIVTYLKGEPTSWHWGERKESK